MSIALVLLSFFFSAPQPAPVSRVPLPLLPQPVAVVVSQPVEPDPPARLPTYHVTGTVYNAAAAQTDSEPFITADNSRIPRRHSSKTRWMALSRDLLDKWGGPFSFGDSVRVSGMSPELDGTYVVHDTMNRRIRRGIDLLVNKHEKHFSQWVSIGKWHDVRIQPVPERAEPAPDPAPTMVWHRLPTPLGSSPALAAAPSPRRTDS